MSALIGGRRVVSRLIRGMLSSVGARARVCRRHGENSWRRGGGGGLGAAGGGGVEDMVEKAIGEMYGVAPPPISPCRRASSPKLVAWRNVWRHRGDTR